MFEHQMFCLTFWLNRYNYNKKGPYSEFLSLAIGVPGLGLQNEESSWPQVLVYPLEEPFESCITPVQVDPFCHTQTQDHIILFPLCLHQHITFQHIVPLCRSDRQRIMIKDRQVLHALIVLFAYNHRHKKKKKVTMPHLFHKLPPRCYGARWLP